jgi:hypothetical protein
MANQERREWFECTKSFDDLNGREKQYIAVGDSADARTARISFLAHVKHNYKSQWHARYKDGYIEFEGHRWKFDRQKQTIRGKRIFLFVVTPEVYILWRRQNTENRIRRSITTMPLDDRLAGEQLIQETAGPQACTRAVGRSDPLALLGALSLSELEALAGLVDVPSGEPSTASPVAA